MRIGFIGAGAVGTGVGILLKDAGHEIVGYYSRSEVSSKKSAELTGGSSYGDPVLLSRKCELLFISTPDDAIRGMADKLSDRGAFRSGQVAAHFSGSQTSKSLQAASQKGAFVLSLHPLQSCSNYEGAVRNLPGSVFSLEGDEEAVAVGKEIVSDLGGSSFVLKAEDKVLYHAAASVASNFLVTLFNMSREMMKASGVGDGLLISALMPLMEGTMANLREMKPHEALTGPIARGDVNTVKDHLDAIRDKMPQLVEAYGVLGSHTLGLAIKKGQLDGDAARRLRDVLEG